MLDVGEVGGVGDQGLTGAGDELADGFGICWQRAGVLFAGEKQDRGVDGAELGGDVESLDGAGTADEALGRRGADQAGDPGDGFGMELAGGGR